MHSKLSKKRPNETDFIPLETVYEDGDIIIVNKQPGLSVHPSLSEPEGTLADALLARYPEIKNVGDPSTSSGQENLRPGIVHRLDKDTSGLLVVARNQRAFDFLKKEWQSGRVFKKYLTLVWGRLKSENGAIKSELARSPKDFRKRIVVKPGKNALAGKSAVTEYRVLKKYRDFSLVEVIPKTGRTHQIRVHMASIGHPVAGDKVYGKAKNTPVGLTRQFLHAYYLSFDLFSKKMVFESDLPDDLEQVLTKLE